MLALPAQADDAAPAEPASRFSGIVQFDFTNVYYFHGVLQDRGGFIWQPWSELYYKLYDSETGPIHSVTVGAGMWNSFQSKRTAQDNTPQWWYEMDLYPLLSIGFAHGLTLTTVYYYYTSPNGAFKTEQELTMKLAWDDSEAFGAWSMKPWVNLAIETNQTAFGPNHGQGLQAGIAPTLWASKNETFPVTLTAPCEVGFAINNYYEYQRFDQTGTVQKGLGETGFGYGNVGLLASLPITAVPKEFGNWSVNVGGKVWFFGNTLANANRGDHVYPQGTVSLAVAF